ncbi:hypothetical protein, partial [Alloprevotella tannerae]|uniref:hypothetical protein n=1 Tax=Alloprevotella tannerae TaxID=76122 RepID=UPI00360B4330
KKAYARDKNGFISRTQAVEARTPLWQVDLKASKNQALSRLKPRLVHQVATLLFGKAATNKKSSRPA